MDQSKSCILKVKVVNKSWNSRPIQSKVIQSSHSWSESCQSTTGRFADKFTYLLCKSSFGY